MSSTILGLSIFPKSIRGADRCIQEIAMTILRLGLTVLLSCLPVPSLFATATLLVVDQAGGSGVFTTVQSAVNAAADGDVILVRAGTYSSEAVLVDGKGLVISAEHGANPLLYLSSLEVKNLGVSQRFVMRGMGMEIGRTVWTDNQGAVWLEDFDLSIGFSTAPVIDIHDCDRFVIVRSSIHGTHASTLFGPPEGTPALGATRSNIAVYDSNLYGGSSGASPYGELIPGDGAVVSGSILLFAGCTIEGGDASQVPGGHALTVLDAGSHVDLLETKLVPGTGAPPGKKVSGQTGAVSILPGEAAKFGMESPRRHGETLTLTFEGPPFSQAWLLKSAIPSLGFLPQHGGALLIDLGTASLLPMGGVPASGTLVLPVTIPSLPAFPIVTLYGQGVFIEPGGAARLGSGSHALLLDPSL
jgi:hypothetical protein